MILRCPPGAYDYPVSYGSRTFYPYRLDHTDDGNPEAGPWLVDVPDALAQYFVGAGGFSIWSEDVMAEELVRPMVRLRKVDGSDASCGYDGVSYEAEADGTVLVPDYAAASLIESHGFELVPDDGLRPARRAKK